MCFGPYNVGYVVVDLVGLGSLLLGLARGIRHCGCPGCCFEGVVGMAMVRVRFV